jgi:hypothetical protein
MSDPERTSADAERTPAQSTQARPTRPARTFGERKYADLALEDRVRLRKPHPCGSYEWRVVRLGADIGLKCEGCGRRVLLPRSEVEKRIKQIVSRGNAAQGASPVEG